MGRVMHVTYSSSISDICNLNSSFDKGVLRICYHGENRNRSFLSKGLIESRINTLFNCPIVCNYDRETDSIGGHDMEVVRSDNGLSLVNITTPVGVVPESSSYHWESVMEDDGTEHEYLCADVLLWKRQEAYEKIKNNGTTGHSMELNILRGHSESGLYIIEDFEFTALCLLGDDVTPCFESSSLTLYSYDDIKRQIGDMMSDLKESFNLNVCPKGGEDLDEKNDAVVETEQVDVSSADFCEENDVEKNEAYSEQEECTDESTDEDANQEETVREGCETEDTSSEFALAGQVYELLCEAVRSVKVQTEWGEECRYWLYDYDPEKMEVYCYDITDWNLYGMPYSMDGDYVVVDFAKCKKKKFEIVDFDEGSREVTAFADAFKLGASSRNAEIESLTISHDEYEMLKEFKASVEKKEDEALRNNIFEKFSDLNEYEEFQNLVSDNAKYSIDDLEEKCFAIRGRHGTTAKFSYEPKASKLIVDRDEKIDEDDMSYGGLMKKYPPKI